MAFLRRSRPNFLALSDELDMLGLWDGLSLEEKGRSKAAVAAGTHPWATEIAHGVVSFFADGEELHEGEVENLLAQLQSPLSGLGFDLRVDTISAPETDSYVIAINGEEVDVWANAESPGWYEATVRPLAVLNSQLDAAAITPRVHVLYAGGNEGLALLINPQVVLEMTKAGFNEPNEHPEMPAS